MHLRLRSVAVLAFVFVTVGATAQSPNDTAALSARVRALEAEQSQLIRKVRSELAALGALPEETTGEPADLKARRKRKVELQRLLADIEATVRADGRTKYIHPSSTDPVHRAYYEQVASKLEAFDLETKTATAIRTYGEVALNFTVLADGQVSKVEVFRATTPEVAERARKVLQAASPLPTFPPELARQADRAVLTARFRFERE